jgi:alanine dehydrogenase
MMETLLLTYNEIEKLFSMSDVLEAVELAFRDKGLNLVEMPPKTYVFFQEHNGDFRVMPCYMKGLEAAGVKVVNVHPNNRLKGLRSVMALIELMDPATGFPLSIMDGTLITAWRTGAAGGVAAKYLARKDSRVMGVIGAGVQGRMQALFTIQTLPSIEELVVWDLRREAVEDYKKEMTDKIGVSVRIASSPREVVEASDVLATCTPARQPVVKGEWIKKGLHINAIGADAPGKRELETSVLYKANKIVVDDIEQASHSGEINVPLANKELRIEDIYGEIG